MVLDAHGSGAGHPSEASGDRGISVRPDSAIDVRGNALNTSAASFREHPMRGSKSGNLKP